MDVVVHCLGHMQYGGSGGGSVLQLFQLEQPFLEFCYLCVAHFWIELDAVDLEGV